MGAIGRNFAGTLVDNRQIARAETAWCVPPSNGPWSLLRMHIVSSMEPNRWPVGLVELCHERRGRSVETATGAGGLDALFNAVALVVGKVGEVQSFEVAYDPAVVPPSVTVEIEALVDGATWRGVARSGDLLLSAVSAYLGALNNAVEGRAGDAPVY